MKLFSISLTFFILVFLVSSCKKDSNPTTNENPSADTVTTPIVKLISPVDTVYGNTSDSTNITIQATDDKGVTKVEFVVDNNVQYSWIVAPYQHQWDAIFPLDSTYHSMYAKAYDADGNVTTTPVKTFFYRGVFSSKELVLQGYSGSSSGDYVVTIGFSLASTSVPIKVEYDSATSPTTFSNPFVEKASLPAGSKSFYSYVNTSRSYKFRLKAQLLGRTVYTLPFILYYSGGWRKY